MAKRRRLKTGQSRSRRSDPAPHRQDQELRGLPDSDPAIAQHPLEALHQVPENLCPLPQRDARRPPLHKAESRRAINPGQPYIGTGPTSWAHTTARLGSEVERSIADEAAGPLAQLLAVPQDGGADGDDDPLAGLKADIRTARGKALLVETTNAGWGEGKAAAPQQDWRQQRLGPHPPEVLAQLRRDAFEHVLAACGTPPSLFTDADGTSQREAVRRWHLNTVLPMARMVEHELTRKLETPVSLKFDSYALDMVSRATVVAKLTQAGVAPGVALAAVGLADDE